MKKIYSLFLSLALISTSSLFGQITIEPNPVTVSDIDVSEFEAVAYSFVTNESSSNATFTWTRNVIEISEGWTSAVCDLNQCYLSFVSTQQFALGAGQTGNLDVHVYPAGNEGSAIIEVTVVNNSNSSSATGLYLFNETLSVPERLTNALKIYPNPASDFITVENAESIERLEIYDVQGKLVREFQNVGKGNLSIGDLQRGNYIVRMWSLSGVQLSSNLLQIQ